MNATHCKRCEVELVASLGATNQSYCGTVCREAWWNESRRIGSTVSSRFGGIAVPDWTDVQASWLAALWDGEGSIGILKTRTTDRPTRRFAANVGVYNTHLGLMERVSHLLGGHVFQKESRANGNHRAVYRLHVKARLILPFLKAIRPYLIIKAKQADLVIAFREALEASPLRTSPSHELFERQHQECVALNRRGTAALEE